MCEAYQQYSEQLDVDVLADAVASPEVIYDGPRAKMFFPTQSSGYGRVTFEKLDALRVCRGEYPPVEPPTGWEYSWVSVVKNSSWLVERHAYENKHYRECYEFGGDVDEMLRDFRHYLFRFHDEFVEAIASGIWIDVASRRSDLDSISASHPLLPLPPGAAIKLINAHDLICEVRASSSDTDQLLKSAQLCSQPLLDFALVLDGEPRVSYRLSVRIRDGLPVSILKSSLGRVEAEFQGVVDLPVVYPYIDSWMKGVRERRRKMGK